MHAIFGDSHSETYGTFGLSYWFLKQLPAGLGFR